MDNKKPLNVNFSHTVYLDAARMYAKKSCKKCYGRGYHKCVTPENEENYSYCSCADRNMKKYG